MENHYLSKMSPAVDYGAGAFLLLIAVLSAVGNLSVLITAFKRSSHLKAPELLSVNLAVTDLGMAITMYPLAIASAWNHAWLGGDTSCIYYGLMGFLFGVTSMMTLAVMAVVRFVVSTSLQSPREKISRRKIHVLIIFTWLYSLLWAVFPLLGWGKYGPEPFGISCTIAWAEFKENGSSFLICIFTLCTIIPAVTIIACYFGIAWKLHVAYKTIKNSNHIPNAMKVERRLALLFSQLESRPRIPEAKNCCAHQRWFYWLLGALRNGELLVDVSLQQIHTAGAEFASLSLCQVIYCLQPLHLLHLQQDIQERNQTAHVLLWKVK
nr:PREDICTED: opsin-5-like isoform X2 [Lepisosteus oculatus]